MHVLYCLFVALLSFLFFSYFKDGLLINMDYISEMDKEVELNQGMINMYLTLRKTTPYLN